MGAYVDNLIFLGSVALRSLAQRTLKRIHPKWPVEPLLIFAACHVARKGGALHEQQSYYV